MPQRVVKLWRVAAAAAATLVIFTARPAEGQVTQSVRLTLDGAKQVAAAAVNKAKELNAPGGAIAVVDDGGNVMYVERLENTFPAGAEISVKKARTAALFRRPSKDLESAIVGGRSVLLNVAEAPLQGGVPIIVNGQVVGAIGVSGAASAAQDEELARAGAAALH